MSAPRLSVPLSGTTRLYGLMGYPLGHSLSPFMHTLAFHHHGLDSLYVPFPVPPTRLPEAVRGAVALGVQGFNVTIPHKEAILPLLDELAPEAELMGAVNTVCVVDGRTRGHNTDGQGFLQPLQALSLRVSELPALVLGAGGAARAVAVALLQAGCPALTLANRTYERGERLAVALQQRFPHAQVRAVPLTRAADSAAECRLIVNATAVGLASGQAELLPAACLRAEHIVYDLVYRPLYTALLQTARRHEATVIPGIEMLLGQGAVAFQLWTGLPFPMDLVRQKVYALLTSSQSAQSGQ
ncbi:MAG: shikimate dehydrogenase (NADP(+)) [Candidatus Tectimicrobiota bacterium]|nr:MAG: shikimate dehydrogenase (NADP(+)) [Candidatus Tectomicrobia bacterium]